MVCRNKDKAEEARADVVKETGNKVKAHLSWPFQNQTFITLNTIPGSLCPHPGPFGDQEGVGIRRGLQEEVQSPQRAGESEETSSRFCCCAPECLSEQQELIASCCRSITQAPL